MKLILSFLVGILAITAQAESKAKPKAKEILRVDEQISEDLRKVQNDQKKADEEEAVLKEDDFSSPIEGALQQHQSCPVNDTACQAAVSNRAQPGATPRTDRFRKPKK